MISRTLSGLRWPWRLALLAIVAVGCVDATPTAEPVTTVIPPPPAEASWEEQIGDVRVGQSDTISVSQRPVTTGQWSMLAEGCDALRILEGDFRLLTADDLVVLAALPNIERLKLDGPVDDAAMKRIANVSGLQVLNLPNGVFTDDGLASLMALPALELLRISSRHVGDAGMKTVAGLPALRFLHLLDVPITDAGLQPLHGMTQLESFYLDGGHCTDAGLYELLKALPELHFHRDQIHLPDDPQTHPHK